MNDETPTQAPDPVRVTGGGRFRKPPRMRFHLALVPPTLLVLWSASLPGTGFFMTMIGHLFIAVGAVVWLVRLLGNSLAEWKTTRMRGFRLSPWYLVAPLAGALVFGVLAVNAPLRLRWIASKGDFQAAVRRAPPPTAKTTWQDFNVPGRLGLYRILGASRVGDGVIFDEAAGNFLDDAGFAFLPSGPFPELENGSFENPQFLALGDGWYAWTASW